MYFWGRRDKFGLGKKGGLYGFMERGFGGFLWLRYLGFLWLMGEMDEIFRLGLDLCGVVGDLDRTGGKSGCELRLYFIEMGF